jgi:general stress protein 26
MLMTMIGSDHSSRPMTVARVDGARIGVLVDATADWFGAVEHGRAVVHLTFSDNRKNTYAALNGRATTTRDRAAVRDHWNPAASAFFEGKDDPNAAVLWFDATEGQYWDGPSGRLGSVIALVRAAVGGDENAGDHGSIAT